ncbi:MAG: diguanylate cyclase [Helicobacteraceae bacterium]|nr:diguanylate cyclase [Helicobacteraceae bacterium]
MKEKYFLNIVTYAPLIIIPLFMVTMSVLFYQAYSNSFELRVHRLETNLLESKKEEVKNKVLNMLDLIVYKKSVIKKRLYVELQERVNNAYYIAHNIYAKNKNTKTAEEIKLMIKTALEPFLWNDGESFIWIVDYDGIFQLAPKYLKHLEGSSIIELKDATGSLIIQEEIAICKSKGSGFLWDTFTKHNGDPKKQYKQVAFVKEFGHYNWYFGTSEYIDTAIKKTDEELFSIIQKVDNIGDNYIFILNTKGKLVLHDFLPQFVDKSIENIDDPFVQKTIKKIIDSLKGKINNAHVYNWYNKNSKEVEKKYSYIQRIPNSDWIIGSGFYFSEINTKVNKEKVALYDIYNKESKQIFYIALVIVLLALVLSFYISTRIGLYFKEYEKKINNKSEELEELNKTLEQRVKVRTTELLELKDSFELLATTDSLTKLHNRYSLMNIVTSEISRSSRYETPLSLIMYDIDFFKKVNDTYGHSVGDDILVELSELVKINLRDVDLIGRYGGEEFIIVLPHSTLENSKIFAQRVKEKVESHSFKVVDKLTISVGVVELKDAEDIDQVFKRVDELLYTSKNAGRNIVSF